MHGLVQCGEKGVAEGGGRGLEERLVQQSVPEYASRRQKKKKNTPSWWFLQEHNVSLEASFYAIKLKYDSSLRVRARAATSCATLLCNCLGITAFSACCACHGQRTRSHPAGASAGGCGPRRSGVSAGMSAMVVRWSAQLAWVLHYTLARGGSRETTFQMTFT